MGGQAVDINAAVRQAAKVRKFQRNLNSTTSSLRLHFLHTLLCRFLIHWTHVYGYVHLSICGYTQKLPNSSSRLPVTASRISILCHDLMRNETSREGYMNLYVYIYLSSGNIVSNTLAIHVLSGQAEVAAGGMNPAALALSQMQAKNARKPMVDLTK
jgi:hypothetical protein